MESLALREAEPFASVAQAVLEDPSLEPSESLRQLGLCAYALLDEAEVDAAGDLVIQCLLAWAAATIGAEDRTSIEHFAREEARACIDAAKGCGASDVQVACAMVTLARLGERSLAVDAVRRACPAPNSALADCVEAFALSPEAELPQLGIEVQRFSKLVDGRPLMLDFLWVSGPLEAIFDRRERIPWQEGELFVVTREDLITLKLTAGRPQDRGGHHDPSSATVRTLSQPCCEARRNRHVVESGLVASARVCGDFSSSA